MNDMDVKKTRDDILSDISHTWKLSSLRPLVPSSSTKNYVFLAYSEEYKTDVVLNLLFTDTHEPQALRFFNGNHCVRLLEYDPELKCLLLEYVRPGISLKSFFPKDDKRALEIAAQLIKKIHVKNAPIKATGFKTVNQWLELLYAFKSKKIPFDALRKAQELSKKLLNVKQELYVLHGDLHHENILKSGDTWIAIDPKGIIGPLEYEVGRFTMNPKPDLLEQPNIKMIIKNRVNLFSALFGFDKQRLIDWAFVQAVLSACWSEEDGNEGSFDYFIKLAQTVENL